MYSIKSRQFEKQPTKTPGPGEYTSKTENSPLKKGPAYGFGSSP